MPQNIKAPLIQSSFTVNKYKEASPWTKGRVGMLYRDLISTEKNESLIAFHIRIPDAGKVSDYVHYHDTLLQVIYCWKGWVRIVYEDQGPPLVMKAGDCILQPPSIRHRVLESSANLEVVEVSYPANHKTFSDRSLSLPTPRPRLPREFGGQRFLHHQISNAKWKPYRISGFNSRDTGINSATKGFASVHIVKSDTRYPEQEWCHNAALLFVCILSGSLTLTHERINIDTLSTGDACVLPPAKNYKYSNCSENLQLLEVSLPGNFKTKIVRD